MPSADRGLRPGIDTKIDGITTTTDRSSVQFMVPTADTPTLPKSSDILLATQRADFQHKICVPAGSPERAAKPNL